MYFDETVSILGIPQRPRKSYAFYCNTSQKSREDSYPDPLLHPSPSPLTPILTPCCIHLLLHAFSCRNKLMVFRYDAFILIGAYQ